jgi:hypothetical protein
MKFDLKERGFYVKLHLEEESVTWRTLKQVILLLSGIC